MLHYFSTVWTVIRVIFVVMSTMRALVSIFLSRKNYILIYGLSSDPDHYDYENSSDKKYTHASSTDKNAFSSIISKTEEIFINAWCLIL